MSDVDGPSGTSSPVGTDVSRAADEIVARLERIPFSRFHWRLFSLLSIASIFDAFDALTIAIALTVIFREFHISFVNAGMLISAAYVGQFFGAIIVGSLSEIYGRKITFISSLVIFGFFSVATALAWSFQSLLVFRLLQGIGLGAEVPIGAALFTEYMRGERRGVFSAVYNAIFGLGLLLCPIVGLVLFTAFGNALEWRILFALGGIPLILAFVAKAKLPESSRWLAEKGRIEEADRLVAGIEKEATSGGRVLEPPKVTYRADTKPTKFGELFSATYLRRTILCFTIFFCSYFVLYGYAVWLPGLYVRLGGLNARTALVLTIITGVVMQVVNYTVALFTDRVGRKPIMLVSFMVVVVGAALGFFLTSLNIATWPTLFVSSLVMSTGGGLLGGFVYVWTPELFPTRMRSWATSASSAWNRIASFISPTVVGVLLSTDVGIGGVFILFGLVSLGGFFVTLALGVETKRQVLESLSA
ncbi:MAG: MFS transporter [Syntrophales bacterium LBB04]|nr:MFS transporter [Syntrophales bacterium LBB04]